MSTGIDIGEIRDDEVGAVVSIRQRAGVTRPWNDPDADIAFTRSHANATVLVSRRDGSPVAVAMVGHDGHRGSVYYVAVDPECWGEGFGRAVMAAAEDWLRARGVRKLNLMVRGDNAGAAAFYQRIGYGIDDRIVLSKWLDATSPSG